MCNSNVNTYSFIISAFPSATGELRVLVKYNKSADNTISKQECNLICLSQLLSSLRNCPLINSTKFIKPVFNESVCLELSPSAKFGKHFKLLISLQFEDEEDQFQSELDSFVSQQPYNSAALALEIWRRQCGFEAPPGMFAALLLHSNIVSVTNTTMKPWQIVKKLWGMISSIDLTKKQLIFGVAEPVPRQDTTGSCPLLSRDGQSPLFDKLSSTQWQAVSQFASKAINQVT